MNETLRPLNLGEILDRTAQMYRRNFWLFAGTAALPLVFVLALAVPVGTMLVTQGVLVGGEPSRAQIAILVVAIVIALPIYLAVYVYSYAGITQGAVSVYHGGRATIRATLKSVSGRFWTYLGYVLLQGLLASLPLIAAAVVILPLVFVVSRPGVDFGTGAALVVVMVLVGVAALGVTIWLWLSYAMGMAVCVVEKKGVWESLVRSWRLSPGARGRIFVTYLLIVALAFGISMALAIPLLIVATVMTQSGNAVANSSAAFWVMEVVRVTLDFASQVLLTPVYFIAAVLFYYDQRMRREGYDIEWMMRQAGLEPAASAGVLSAAAPAAAAATAAEFPPSAPPDRLGER